MTDIDIQLFLRHPIGKLLVLIKQSSYLIYLCHNVFDRQKETKSMRLRSIYFSSFIFENKLRFIEENKSSEKAVIAEEELNRFDIDGIENLERFT